MAPGKSLNFSGFRFSLKSYRTEDSLGYWFGFPRTPGEFYYNPFRKEIDQFGQSLYNTWTESLVLNDQGPREVTAVHWSLAQRAWGPVIALFPYLGSLTQIPMKFLCLVKYDCGFLVKMKLYQICVSVTCTHTPPSQSCILSFFCASYFRRISFLLSEGCLST